MTLLPSDVRLNIAGNGPETDYLTEQTVDDPRIKWLGQLDSAKKNAHLINSDLFCAPSLSGESFGVVLLEAMASKTPIVASDIEGYANVARKDEDAVLVSPGNPEALAQGILKVLGNKAFTKKISCLWH